MDILALVDFVRGQYPGVDFVTLHQPTFAGNEKRYVEECIDTTFVSSVGRFVTRFEEMLAEFTGAKHAVAISNGTSALHLALHTVGVKHDDAVITQPLTFVATCNATRLCGAEPFFVDVDRATLGMCPEKLSAFLEARAERRSGGCFDKPTGRRIGAVVPMHTFGFACHVEAIAAICEEWGIPLVEDAAESLGTWVGDTHTGRFGAVGVLSFNGNKTITTGGGGALLTDDTELAKRLKHLSTTAKRPHAWEFFHDEVAFNYRMPNINAALGCAQMEVLPAFLAAKRALAERYARYGAAVGLEFVSERAGTRANHWLNALLLPGRADREAFLQETNARGIMTRPIWTLMNKLPMYAECPHGNLAVAHELEDRVVNIPSWPLGF